MSARDSSTAVLPFNVPEFDPELSKKVDDNANYVNKGENSIQSSFSLAWFGLHFTDIPHKAPALPAHELFFLFCSFGFRAFGGPSAQIALMKDEIVIDKQWISLDRFNKVYDIYQKLPGPEATELACYLGNLSRGRLGAFLGGLGFILPGVLLMLLSSFLYNKFGENNQHTQRSFRCMQLVVSAFVFRSNFKLAEFALSDNNTRKFSWCKGFLSLFCFLVSKF